MKRTSDGRRASVLGGLALAATLGFASVSAGEAEAAPPGEGSAPAANTEESTFEAPVGSARWRVRLQRDSEARSPQSRLTLRTQDSSDASIETVLPGWAGPPKYSLKVESAEIAPSVAAILSTLSPSEKKGGTSSVTLQVAWVGERNSEGKWSWEVVRRVEHSTLEGGRELAIRRENGSARLVEVHHQLPSRLCGPDPSSEFARKVFDPATGRFSKHTRLEQFVRSARRLDAVVPDEPLSGPFTRGIYQWYWATSSQDTSSTTSGVVRPMQLGDRRGGSTWTVDARDGVRGEFATANVASAVPVRALQFVPGKPADEDQYQSHGRPKEMLVAFSDGTRYVVEFPEVDYQTLVARRGVIVELPEPVRTSCMSVLYLSYRQGRRTESTEGGPAPVSIAEVAPLTVVDAPTAQETATRIVDTIASEPNLRTRRRIAHISSGVHAELDAAVAKALETTEGKERRRILPLLDQLAADRAVPILVEFFRELEPDDVEYRPVKRGLAAHGARAADPLLELIEEWEPDQPKYIDAVRLVGRVGTTSHLKSLAGSLGDGSKDVRNARIRAVASAGESVLSRLFSVAAVGGSEVRTRDALTAIYLIGKRRHRDAPGTHSGSGALLEVIERSGSRRTLMHAFRAARYYRVGGLVSRVRTTYRDHSDPLVRRAAISSIARYPGATARRMLEESLDDSSPDVRIAAVSAIRSRSDRRKSTGALLEYLDAEGWSAGQQQALKVLAAVEVPETQKFFRRLLLERRDSKLALRAARVLSRASRAIDVDVARELVVDRDAPRRLRVQMVEILGFDESSEGEAFLLSLLEERAARESIAERSELRAELQRRAIMALGRRRSETAKQHLLEMARSNSDRDLRREAIRALGFYRDPKLVETLRAWRPEAPPELRPTLNQTIQMIENRGVIDEMERQIDETLDTESEGGSSSGS